MSSQAESIVPDGPRLSEPRLSDTDIQDMLAKSVRLYAERSTEREGGLPAFASNAATATEVMVTVTAMLKAVNLQVFELGMWQAWSGR